MTVFEIQILDFSYIQNSEKPGICIWLTDIQVNNRTSTSVKNAGETVLIIIPYRCPFVTHKVDVGLQTEIFVGVSFTSIDVGGEPGEVGGGLDEVRALRGTFSVEVMGVGYLLPVPFAVVIDFSLEFAIQGDARCPVLHCDTGDSHGSFADRQFVGVALADLHRSRIRDCKILACDCQRDKSITAVVAVVPPDCRIRIPGPPHSTCRLGDTFLVLNIRSHRNNLTALSPIP